ncbi:MAG: OmpH family outer membrane protein [bacterium]|nr:OmpH family outer membrane protein [bacterium]
MRKSYPIVLAMLLFIAISSAYAETTELEVAFINMEKLASKYEEFTDVLKGVEGEIRTAQEEDMAKLNEYNEKIKALEVKLSGPLTDEAKAAAETEYIQLYNEAMAYQENAYGRYEQMQVDALQVVYKKVYAKISSIAQNEEYEAVFDSAVFAYIDETKVDDITDQVLEELNAEYGVPAGNGGE